MKQTVIEESSAVSSAGGRVATGRRGRTVARVIPNSVRDEARREVAARGLTPVAVAHLTRDALGTIDLAALAPVKKLLKRFFSNEVWTAEEDDALADRAGSGDGWWRHELDDDFRFEFGWRDGA